MDGSPEVQNAEYQSALDFLYGRINYERTARGVPSDSRLNLDRTRQLLDGLGNPQQSLKVVHIAGTKGKGSTAAMIAATLSSAGYKTGLYTSPHLDRLEERIRIDGIDCTAVELVELVDALRPVVAEFDRATAAADEYGHATFFEVTTAMAMLHFSQQDVDVAVLEVGLGGRLDSTNVCCPAVTVITSISFDHTQQLGNSLSEIAREKAGIIKPGVPLVCGAVQEEARAAIDQVAAERGACLHQLGIDFKFQYRGRAKSSAVDSGGEIDYHDTLFGKDYRLDGVSVGMIGAHQATNATIAIATICRLQAGGWKITETAIRQGIATARCRARIEVISREPLVILDTAHNLASVDALLSALAEAFDQERRILIFAATRDKDVSGMLRHLLPQFESVILTRYANNPRGVSPRRLLELVDNLRPELSHVPEVTLCDSPVAAWQKCQRISRPEHLICVTGSFFLAAEMRPLIAHAVPSRIG